MRSGRIALAAVIVVAAPCAAQTHELELRIDSLARIAEHSAAALHAFDDSVRRHQRASDTVYARDVAIVADADVAALAKLVAPAVMDSVRSIVGAAISHLAGHVLRVSVEKRMQWWTRGDTARELIVSILRRSGAEMRGWRAPVDSTSIVASLGHALRYAVYGAGAPALLAWAGGAVPADSVRSSDWATHRLLLISAGTAVATRCYGGDLEACRIALLLRPATDPVLAWHDSTSRGRLVRRHGDIARRIDADQQRQCQGGSDRACIALLQQFPPATFAEPAARALRGGLLTYALQAGGAGATERLLTSAPLDLAARLEHASGMPIDSLLASWQQRVHDTKAPSPDLSMGVTVAALAWITGIGALSLRSSRWR